MAATGRAEEARRQDLRRPYRQAEAGAKSSAEPPPQSAKVGLGQWLHSSKVHYKKRHLFRLAAVRLKSPSGHLEPPSPLPPLSL